MSAAFPTFKQFRDSIRRHIVNEYSGEPKESIDMCLDMQASEQIWLQRLGELIEIGVTSEYPVLDTLTPEQLYSLKKHYAPRESLDNYIPRKFRNARYYTPISRKA